VRARDRERFEKLLLEEKARIARELEVMEGAARRTPRDASGDLSAYSHHMADAGTDAMGREQSFMLTANLARTLTEIEDALRRVRDGSYGVCGRCARAIGVKRLLALPYAQLCLACQETVDQRRDSAPPTDRP
jgi:RNA polymerase-binding transcription factor DksA